MADDELVNSEYPPSLLDLPTNQSDQPSGPARYIFAWQNQQILREWNATTTGFPTDICIHKIFEAQVEQTPNSVALFFEETSLTYRELNQRANQLAHYLHTLGVGPEIFVGLCLERSLEMVVGLLAILKAGGVYVPLDPTYPQERLAFLLHDAQITILLTQQSLVETLPIDSITQVCIDTDWPLIVLHEEVNPTYEVRAGNLAYVIYTSGSTGKPKGVTVEHKQLLNYTCAVLERLDITAGFSFAMVQPLTVDSCITTIFPPLCTGGSLHIISPSRATDSYLLADYFRHHRIDCLKIAPSHLAALHTSSYGTQIMPRQRLIIGGESSRWSWVHKLQDLAPNCVIFNHYGPTETTVGVLIYRLESGPDSYLTTPLGYPIANTQIYLLDEYLQPVPMGVSAELYIGGANLARGYLNRPELVAEKFIPDPSGREPGARLYKTGDLARYLPDGKIEFLGRIDDQVKIRGFRIELQEIEAALSQHSNVRETIVLSREDDSGHKRLVAYVVPDRQPIPTDSELRSFLGLHLPDYMLPAAFVLLESLPRTSHGKVDRRMLPAPSTARPALERDYVAPRTDLEHFLAGMWKEMLGIENIGIYDTFFELGGDSIKGAILVNKIQEKLGEIIYIVALFDAPTIADFALYLNEHYRDAVLRHLGTGYLGSASQPINASQIEKVNAEKVAQLRQLITPLSPRVNGPPSKNPPAIFVLAPPRSGTTLLRVMLGKHPDLFSPPELGLLSFNTLEERKAAFSGRDSFRLEGTIRAIMDLKSCDVETAKQIMASFEDQRLSTQQFYGLMQEWIGEKVLIDKTPPYALDLEVLRRAETDFENARYIHLIRHPYGMIQSFKEAKLDRIFFWRKHSFSVQELAELVWLICHQNILAFLQDVPAHRQHRVYFENLVKQPRQAMEGISQFLGIEFHQDMVQPYKEEGRTDGIYAVSRMMGDVKFYEHKGIDAEVADRWKERYAEDFLGDLTWDVAEKFGYKKYMASSNDTKSNDGLSTRTTITSIQPVSRDTGGDFPLSFPQLRLWFLDQWEPANPLYNMHQALHLEGPLQWSVLERCFNEIILRHDALRTTFVAREGLPVQVIAPTLEIPLTRVDLTVLPAEQRETQARHWMTQEIMRPFDLVAGPLLRVSLLQLGAQEHMLLLTKHHIISDAWSTAVLFRELAVLYEAFLAGKPSPLPDLPIQYPDFALWQREWLQGEIFEQHLSYWKQQLGGAPSVLELPTDRPRPPVQTYQGARHTFVLPQALTDRLKALSRDEGVTLYMTLLTVFQVLLFRYTGQEDFLIGTPIANRTRAEIEDLIGFFINTLVMRGDLSGNPRFVDVLARVREMALGAYAHQDMPFEQLVEALAPRRDVSHPPLYQVIFSLQNAPRTIYGLPDIQIRPLVLKRQTAKVDLALTLQEAEQGLHGWWEYNIDLFDASTISRMQEHFLVLLQSLVTEPQHYISTVPLLTNAEYQQIVREWNATETDYPQEHCIHELFEMQVEHTPNVTALICMGERLTYLELNQRASHLAHYLHKLGVGPDILVGLCLPRSLDMIIAILAILKAGGAYVPLDPSYPTERLAFQLHDAQISILLTYQQICTRLPEYKGMVVLLDTDQHAFILSQTTNIESKTCAENLAYVIYTSGSTGKPKGVQVHHRALVNRTLAMIEMYGLDTSHRQLQFVSPGFDVLAEEIFPTLCCGAAVVLDPRSTEYSPSDLLSECGRLGVSKINMPASYWHQVVDELSALEQPLPESLKLAVTGAESPSAEKLLQWIALAKHSSRFFNVYGPTEATILATYYEVPLDSVKDGHLTKIPIGRPLPNTQIYLLDPHMQLVPIGVPGELYIGGVGLARGYLHQPNITAERFVPHPFSEQPGARLYRTGDTARYLPNGLIEFIGRLDRQVKVRGFRIELEEIETVLVQHPAIREAVVLAREDIPNDKRLVAYIVTQPQQVPTVGELRSYLQEQLPEYMLPSAFVMLDAFPLTTNSKLDRQALPPPGGSLSESGGTYIAPRNSTEEVLADIWMQVIGIKQVGIYDNFFEIGGHSLLATQVIARVRSSFQMELPLRTLFEVPTVAQLGAAIVQKRAEETDNAILAQMLADLEQLPEDDVQTMFAVKKNMAVKENSSE